MVTFDGVWAGRRGERLGIVLLMLLVAGLTIPFLGRHSFWFDEVFSVIAASSWSGLLEIFAKYENNMALYYVLLHGWMTLGGDESTVRLLSVLFALAAIPVLHVLTRSLFDVRVALIADALLACNTMFLRYAQEARSYGLLLLLSVLSSALFVRGLKRPTWGVWLGYAVTVAASVYAHYFGILIACAHVGACLLWNGGWSRRWSERPAIPWRQVLVSAGVVIALLLPLLVFRPESVSQVDELTSPSLADLIELVMQFCGGRTLTLAYLACLLLAGWSWWRGRDAFATKDRWWLWFLVVWAVAPVVVVFAFSVLIKPIFIPKYLIGCLPAVIVLVAVGLSRLRTWMVVICLAGFLVMLLVNFHRRGIASSEPWREMVAHVVQRAQPGDLLVCYPYYVKLPVDYYLDRQTGRHDQPPKADFASGPYHPGGGASDPLPDLVKLEQQVQAHPRVWAIFFNGGEKRLNREWRPAIEDLLRRQHPQVESITYPSQLTWIEYDVELFSAGAEVKVDHAFDHQGVGKPGETKPAP